ncbi:MAG: hypothetical protein AAFW73_22965 [Bacteroidota bacterium]
MASSERSIVENRAYEFAVRWVDKLDANFEFTKEWTYPDDIHRNRFGQLVCLSNCPPELEEMRDEAGKVFPQFLPTLYGLIDTSHLFYSLESETNAPDFLESHFVTVSGNRGEEVCVRSATNVVTHSSLNIRIKASTFSEWIDFGSIVPTTDKHRFELRHGTLEIDRGLWERGILRAKFDFRFDDTLFHKQEIPWTGRLNQEITEWLLRGE